MTATVATRPYLYDPSLGEREDEALKAHLEGLTVMDRASIRKGDNGGLRVVPVFFRVPEDEARRNTFPYFTIDPLETAVRDPTREHRGTVIWSGTEGYVPFNLPTEGDFARSDYPVPVNFRYQITSWNRYAQQDRNLLMQAVQGPLASRFGCLVVGDTRPGANDSDFSLRRLDIDSGPIPSVIRESEQKRIFRQVWTVTVSSEVLLSAFTPVDKVTEVDITTAVE